MLKLPWPKLTGRFISLRDETQPLRKRMKKGNKSILTITTWSPWSRLDHLQRSSPSLYARCPSSKTTSSVVYLTKRMIAKASPAVSSSLDLCDLCDLCLLHSSWWAERILMISSTVSSRVARNVCVWKPGDFQGSATKILTSAPRCTTGVDGWIRRCISSLKQGGAGRTLPNFQGILGWPARCWGLPNQHAMCASVVATSSAICSSCSSATVPSTGSPCAFCNPTNCSKGLTFCATAVSRSWSVRWHNSEMILPLVETMRHFLAFSFRADSSARSAMEKTLEGSKRTSPPRLYTVTPVTETSVWLSVMLEGERHTWRNKSGKERQVENHLSLEFLVTKPGKIHDFQNNCHPRSLSLNFLHNIFQNVFLENHRFQHHISTLEPLDGIQNRNPETPRAPRCFSLKASVCAGFRTFSTRNSTQMWYFSKKCFFWSFFCLLFFLFQLNKFCHGSDVSDF